MYVNQSFANYILTRTLIITRRTPDLYKIEYFYLKSVDFKCLYFVCQIKDDYVLCDFLFACSSLGDSLLREFSCCHRVYYYLCYYCIGLFDVETRIIFSCVYEDCESWTLRWFHGKSLNERLSNIERCWSPLIVIFYIALVWYYSCLCNCRSFMVV